MLMNDAAVGLATVLAQSVVLPLASLAKQERWPKQVNALIALAIAGGGGVAVELMTGGFHGASTPADWISCVSTSIAASQLMYHLLFKDSPLDTALAGLGAAPVVAILEPEYVPVPLPAERGKQGS